MKDAQGRTLNKDGSVRKSGSGRRKGSTSFSNVTLNELQKFCGESMQVPVSRKWLEQIGVLSATKQQKKTQEVKAVEEPEGKIAFVLHK